MALEIYFFNLKINKKQVAWLLVGLGLMILFVRILFNTYGFDYVFGQRISTNGEVVNVANYLLTQPRSVFKYIQLMFLPVGQNVDYYFPISNSIWELKTLLALLGFGGLLGLMVYLFKKNRIASLAILWLLLGIAISSSVIPMMDAIFEHRLYIAMFGFGFLVVSTIYKLSKADMKKTMMWVGLLIGVYVVMTFSRNKVWKTELDFWADAVKKSPQKLRTNNNYGSHLQVAGQYQKAIGHHLKALEVDPNHDGAHANLGYAYLQLKNYDKSIEHYLEAIRINPDLIKAYVNIGFAKGKQGKYDEALEYYEKVIEMNPLFVEAYNNIGNTYFLKGDYEKAREYFQRALEIDPRFKLARDNLIKMMGK